VNKLAANQRIKLSGRIGRPPQLMRIPLASRGARTRTWSLP